MKELIVRTLYTERDGENVAGVARVMESVAFGRDSRRLDEEVVDRAKAYLAKKCDRRVLREWSSRPYQIRSPTGNGSWGYSYLVPYFGVCHYQPAVPYLLWMLDAASLNVVLSSLDALKTFYPNDQEFSSLSAARTYYTARYRAARRR